MITIIKLICRDRPTLDTKEYLSFLNIFAGEEDIEKLEDAFRKYVGTDYALSFGTARLAFYLIYKNHSKGKEIIAPSFGCIPVADSITWSRNTPRFTDIDLKTYNIDPKLAEKNITSKTKILAPVHLFGLSADMDAMIKLKEKHNLLLVEDAAMSLGAEYKKNKVGGIGDAAVFSLDRSKMITSYHGGIMTTNSKKIYDSLKKERESLKKTINGHRELLRLYIYHTASNPYIWNILYRIWKLKNTKGTTNTGIAELPMPEHHLQKYSPIQATVARKQLKKVDGFIEKRRKNSRILTKALSNNTQIAIPQEPKGHKHIYARYVIRLKKSSSMNRQNLITKLIEKGIDPGFWYSYSLPYTEYYKKFNQKSPNAKEASKSTLTLPNYPSLKKNDMKHIADTVNEILKS